MAFNPLTQTFDTIADLKTRKGTDGASVEVLGYYTKGDGGKGSYYYDDASVETENGGTIIKPTNVSVGRWKLVHSGEVNAANFGVVTGDTAQNAQITAALAVSGVKTLVFNHLVTKSYTIASAITVPSGIILKFENDNKFIFSGGSLSGGIIDCDYRKQCFGGDLTVTGLENIVRSAMWFGAKTDAISGNPTPTDNLIPAQKAVDSCIVPGKVYFPGATAGTGYFYYFSTTWTVTKRVEIYGDGYGSVTTFLFDGDEPGVELSGSSGSQYFHDVRVRGTYGSSSEGFNSSTAHAVTINSNDCIVERVTALGFDGNGFDVDGASGNANSWRLINSRAEGNGRAGIYTHGGDSNAGYCASLRMIGNARMGLWENSFLGNVYNGGNITSNVINHPLQKSLVRYRAAVSSGGNRYRATAASTNVQPGVTSGWASFWTLIEAGGVNSTYQAWSSVRAYASPASYYALEDNIGVEPTITSNWEDTWLLQSPLAPPFWNEWFDDEQYYFGGGGFSENPNARNIFLGIYKENDQPAFLNQSPSLVIGGVAASGTIRGGIAMNGDGIVMRNLSLTGTESTENVIYLSHPDIGTDSFLLAEDELSGGYIDIRGSSSSGFSPLVEMQPEGTSSFNTSVFIFKANDGVGSNAAVRFSARTFAGGSLATNRLFAFQNVSTDVLTIDANGMLTNSALSGTGSRLIQAGGTGAITAMGWTVPSGNGTSGQVITSDGTGGSSWATPSGGGGSGDMLLGTAQTVTAAKTYNDTTLLLRNVANTFNGSFTNANTADRIYTLPNVAGTIALTSNITGTNSGTNTGDQTTITGNAGSATILQTGRTIAITGDLAYTSPSFNGSANVTAAGTLATVNSNVGSFGSATQAGTFTVNGKGLITAASNTSIQIAESQVTNLTTDLAAKQGTITLTTAGTSGASTLVGDTLNIPQYTGGGGGSVTDFIFTDGGGFDGTVGTSTSTPTLSIIPSFTGWAYSNGSALAAGTISTGLTNTTGTLTANLSVGVGGGQSVIGGTGSGDDLTLSSTSNATKGYIQLGTSIYDEVNNFFGIKGTPGYALDVWSGNIAIVIGADVNLLTRTNATNKNSRFGSAHYTNAEEPAAIFYYTNSSTFNTLNIGGGTGSMNAATSILFHTASNSTTTSGTERLSISNTEFTINDGGANYDVRMEGDTDPNAFVLDANGGGGGGGIGIGVALGSIDAKLKLAAGTATAGTAPLKFTSGTLQTTAEAGAVEFLTDAFYGTITTGAARKQFLFTDGSAASLTSFPTFNQNTTGSAATLTTSRNINGTAFNGSADITVTAAAGTLTGTVLNATVVTSSLTTIGTITSGGLGTGAVIGGVTMTLGSDAANDIYYRNGSGVLTRLANGTTNQFLSANTGAAPSWATPSGSGNVSKVGTPVDNQIGIWTGDGTIEGSTQLTFTGQALQLASTNTTQATTSSILAVAANSLTTGTAQYIASSSITTGNLLNLVTTGTAAAAGNEALNIDRSGANGTSSITVTGARITLANTGTTSTNVGMDIAVSGASTNTAITANSDVEITDTTKGVILKSPDGTRWRLTIGNTGIITTTSL